MTLRPFNNSPTLAANVANWAVGLALTAGGVLAPLAHAQAPGGKTAPPARAAAAESSVTLNFVNAEIEAVARAFAAILNRNVVVDPRVKGTLTLTSERPLSRTAAYNQFLSALRLQGFAVVDAGGLIKVLPEAEAKLQAGSVSVADPARAAPGTAQAAAGGQLVTQIIRLNHENANNLVPVLRPLISPNNTITVNSGNNSLIITDYADNLARIGQIVGALDMPAAGDMEIIVLKHAVAADVAALVARVLEGGTAASGAAPQGAPAAPAAGGDTGRASVVVDSRINALLVRGASAARVQMVRNMVDRLDQPSPPGANIWVVYLKHTDATRLAQVLRAALGAEQRPGQAAAGAAGTPGAAGVTGAPPPQATPIGGLGGAVGASAASTAAISPAGPVQTGGNIQADPATNSLIITAPESQYRHIRAVIDRLDVRRAQVYVESLIVEVSANRAAEFGIQWQGATGRSPDRQVGVLGTNFGADGNNILSQQVRAATGQTPNIPGAGFNFGVLNRINGIYALTTLARALETRGEANILSTPNILTMDNEEARITVGQNVPFLTGQLATTGAGVANPFQTIERRDVGIVLRVRPQIGSDGTVRMAVFQEVSSVAEVNVNGPVTNRRAIESNVLVEDGQVIVIGGLLSDNLNQNRSQVPLAGDVPLLGWLFRSERRTAEKTNLLVFLRPVVLRNAESTEALSSDRYELIRAVQRNRQPEPSVVVPINQGPVLPPLSAPPAGESPITPATPTSPARVPPPLLPPSMPARVFGNPAPAAEPPR